MTKAIEHEDTVAAIYETSYLEAEIQDWRVRDKKSNKMVPIKCESITGWIETKHGIVLIQTLDHPDYDYTSMQTIYNGKEYQRKYKRHMTQLGIVRKAKKFAQEVVEGKVK